MAHGDGKCTGGRQETTHCCDDKSILNGADDHGAGVPWLTNAAIQSRLGSPCTPSESREPKVTDYVPVDEKLILLSLNSSLASDKTVGRWSSRARVATPAHSFVAFRRTGT